ncbi:hypothetical protein AB0D49_17800 [Streptomyces sp. NPDC048290]|uniref:hypothetical protein n=1 Tax=Streptomyces sp. NPDC048290 TaxID=3155811 RepID=UPI003448E1A9
MRVLDFKDRRSLLESAGLLVVQDVWRGEAPEPMEVWRPIVSGEAEPAVRVHVLEANGHLSEVQKQWVRLSDEMGLFGKQGDFLISVAGVGAVSAPWAHVRRTNSMQLAQRLGFVRGEPEFVALSLDGRVSCGVTTEEYEVWVLAKSID